jgi:hypothetical protein
MHAWLGCSPPSSMLIRYLPRLSPCWACGGDMELVQVAASLEAMLPSMSTV